jgi:plastocyanin
MRDLEKIAALALFVAIAGAARGQTPGIDVRVVDRQGTPVADAVVVAVPADPNVRLPARLAHGNVVDQIDKQFVPRVQVVEVGTAVTFPNNDHVRHQVYSFSPARRFELPLYAGVPAKPILFDKPGIVVLGCNIHDWMIGYIYVSESPFFAKSDASGAATIADLAPRTFVVRVWHPRRQVSEAETRREVTLAPGRTVDLHFTLPLAAESRVRRAPGVDHGTHY